METDPVYNIVVDKVERALAYFKPKCNTHEWLMMSEECERDEDDCDDVDD